MFTFFSKKHFLVDYLDGFVDIHNHILPGIDDGAKTIDDSIELIRGMGEFGVKDFICTPHIMDNYYPNTPESIQSSYNILIKELDNKNLNDVSIRFAAEHMIDSNFETLLENDQVMPLDKSFLLIEMSYLQPSINFDDAISKIKSKGYFPILAHPERYIYLSKTKSYEHYKNEGVHFQMNILSVFGYYGNTIQKLAIKLLDDFKFDFVATDTHKIDHLKILKTITLSDKYISKILPILENTKNVFKKI